MSAVLVHLYDDATLKSSPGVSGGLWSVSALTLSMGDHTLKARAEDQAGNISGYSAIKNIKTGSLAKPTVDLLDDSGQSSVDNITNDNTPRIQVVLDLNSEAPSGFSGHIPSQSVSAIKLYKKTGASTYELVETFTAAEGYDYGEWTYTHQVTSALDDGVHEYCASWVDAQGNESSKSVVLSITIDTAAPNAPAISNIQDGQIFVGTSIEISGTAS